MTTDQVKKQTNIGIALAIIGFALVGGALVLIPQLVEKRIESLSASSLQAAKTPAALGTSSPKAHPPKSTVSVAQPQNDRDNTQEHNSEPEDLSPVDTENASSDSPPAPDGATAGATPEIVPEETALPPSATGPWQIIFRDKFEINPASKPSLDFIVEKIKNDPTLQLEIVGINNIMKSSKLAQMGANKISGIIAKEAKVNPARFNITILQQPDLENVIVKISVLGGAQ